MKNVIIAILIIVGCFQSSVFAKDVIYSTKDGTRLKCTAIKKTDTIPEYKSSIVDYYVFKNGKLYSDNLSKMLGKNKKAKRVYRLCISDKEITFKDRMYLFGASYYKWVTIDKRTGKYKFDAKKQFNWAWYFQMTNAAGTCKIVN